jgi:hypothetical protein
MRKRHRRAGAAGTRAVRLGYKLSSEERGPRELVRLARQAEETGFGFGLISRDPPAARHAGECGLTSRFTG